MEIAIYTRKSVVKNENCESIETQIELCKRYFKNSDDNFSIFCDKGYSGGNTNRPDFKKMINMCKLNKFDIVATYKVDRISRNIVDFVNIYEELKKTNTKLVSVTEGFDTTTPIGEMMMFLLSAFANMERENIKQRVKDSMINLAKKGCFTGGFVPFGCVTEKKDDKSYLLIKDADLIKFIYDKYLEMRSLHSTQKYLLEKGIKTFTSKSSLGNMLRNPVYVESSNKVSNYLKNKGYEIVGKANKCGYTTYGKTTGTPLAIVGKHKACIESDTFLKVNMMLDENKDKAIKRESKTYWLTGVLICPFCNSEYVLINSGNNTYYACKNRLNRNSNGMGIDKNKVKCKNSKYVNAIQIESKVEEYISSLENKNKFDQVFSENKSFDNEISILENKINENEKYINNLVNKLMLLNNTSSEAVVNKINELSDENSKLKDTLEELRYEQLEEIKNRSTSANIKRNILNFKNLKSNKDKRIAIKEIFKKIVYNPYEDKAEFEFK